MRAVFAEAIHALEPNGHGGHIWSSKRMLPTRGVYPIQGRLRICLRYLRFGAVYRTDSPPRTPRSGGAEWWEWQCRACATDLLCQSQKLQHGVCALRFEGGGDHAPDGTRVNLGPLPGSIQPPPILEEAGWRKRSKPFVRQTHPAAVMHAPPPCLRQSHPSAKYMHLAQD